MNQKSFLDLGQYLIHEVRRRADKGSPHFFDIDTMSFFSSRISELCWQYQDDVFFITSEKNRGYSSRAWTIRKIDIDGDIVTIGDFQQYGSLRDARNGIKDFIN